MLKYTNVKRVTLNNMFTFFASDIIDGLEELHSLGYYCPDLKCNCVAVIRQSGSISAKIWKFDRCDPGKNYLQSW